MSSQTTLSGVSPTTITLGEDLYSLRPTLGAAIAINRAFGGLQPALDRIVAVDITALATVIAAGTSDTSEATVRRIVEGVFVEGASGLVAPLSAYILTLADAGRAAAKAAGKGDGDGEEGAGAGNA